MVEKLSELGAAAFIPLAAERSVVLPEGKGKHGRWSRIAAEAAKQSRRSGVMRVDEMVTVDRLLADLSGPAWYFSTRTGAVSLAEAVRRLGQESAPHAGRLNRGLGEGMRLTLLIGPEGGWTDGEVARFENAGLTAVSLGRTILRIETAAVAAAALAAAVVTPAIEAGAP
jgi:16S rRNA (uracil1498-N3)-methyltransferase